MGITENRQTEVCFIAEDLEKSRERERRRKEEATTRFLTRIYSRRDVEVSRDYSAR